MAALSCSTLATALSQGFLDSHANHPCCQHRREALRPARSGTVSDVGDSIRLPAIEPAQHRGAREPQLLPQFISRQPVGLPKDEPGSFHL